MEIPPYTSSLLNEDAAMAGRESAADIIRTMPERTVYTYGDRTDLILVRKCDGTNIFPKLRHREKGSEKAQIIFEIRGRVHTDAKQVFHPSENDEDFDGTEDTLDCVFPTPFRFGMLTLSKLNRFEQEAVLIAAFARRNSYLKKKWQKLGRDEEWMEPLSLRQRLAQQQSITWRLAELEKNFQRLMESIGAIPRAEPTVY